MAKIFINGSKGSKKNILIINKIIMKFYKNKSKKKKKKLMKCNKNWLIKSPFQNNKFPKLMLINN